MGGEHAKRTVPTATNATRTASQTASLHSMTPDAASEVLRAAADVLENQRTTEIHGFSISEATALWELFFAETGHKDRQVLGVALRKQHLDHAIEVIDPAITAYLESDPGDDGREWVAERIQSPLQRLRYDIAYLTAKDRVERSFLVDGKGVVDPDDDTKPHEQAALLHTALPKLVSTVRGVNETVLKMHEVRLEHQVEEQIEGHFHGHIRFGSLLEIANALAVLDSMLLLTDDEIRKNFEAGGVAGKIATVAELVKASVEVAGGAIGVTASTIEIIAKVAGENELAQLAGALARGAATQIGKIVTIVDGLHGLLVAADSNATIEQRIDGGVDFASDALWLVYQVRKTASLGAASFALRAGYYAAKFALEMNWQSALGAEAGIMRRAFDTLSRHGVAISSLADEVAKARELADQETNPEQRSLLYKVLVNESQQLGGEIDSLINDTKPLDVGDDRLGTIGGSRVLVQALAPIEAYRGARSPADTLLASEVALERIRWTLEHAEAIVKAETKEEGLDAVSADGEPKVTQDGD